MKTIVIALTAIASTITLVALLSDTLEMTPKSFEWTETELEQMASLAISNNESYLSASTGNRWADDESAAEFGHTLFFDTRMSKNGEIACASCHQPQLHFNDRKSLSKQSKLFTLRNTPTIVGAAASPWQFWDGRADSLWSQALGPLENDAEHGGDRTQIAKYIYQFYAEEYQSIFGPFADIDFANLPEFASPLSTNFAAKNAWTNLPQSHRDAVNRVFANVGKAIEAYERKLMPSPSKFDRFVQATLQDNRTQADHLFDLEEKNGLRLFLSEKGGRCVQCHNGPMLSNFDFQALAVPPIPQNNGDQGRIAAFSVLDDTEFHCGGRYSDADATIGECDEFLYAKRSGDELIGAFKVPSLRNISKTAPYMHRGQLRTLREVLSYYNRAPVEPLAHTDIEPLKLLPYELNMIEEFLHTLDSPVAAEEKWLRPPNSLPRSYSIAWIEKIIANE